MKSICVGDVCDIECMRCVVTPEDEALENVIRTFAQSPLCGGVFLVDSRQRFAGRVTRTSLLKWASVQLSGRIGGRVAISDIFSSVFSTKAKDLARGSWRTMGVKTTDDIETALHQLTGEVSLSWLVARSLLLRRLAKPYSLGSSLWGNGGLYKKQLPELWPYLEEKGGQSCICSVPAVPQALRGR